MTMLRRLLLLLFSLFLLLISPALAEWPPELEEVETVTVQSDTDPADTSAAYIQSKLFPRPTLLRAVRFQGLSLPEMDRAIYIVLRNHILAVAAGEETSTVFGVDADLFLPQTTFTANDLGLDHLSENGALTEEAKQAVRNRFAGYSSSNIIYALLADCPYELYWYKKGKSGSDDPDGGCSVAKGIGYRLNTPAADDTGEVETVTLRGYLQFSMAVSEDYRSYGSYPYRVDAKYGQGVSAAVSAASEIVSAYEDLNEYDRLHAYKEAICSLVSYDHDAPGTAYGNPWQIIWVFDGDPETNVVCEGYAKAFKYLNDRSASSAVTVAIPQGYLGSAAHMWNIVTMENDRNYLVDVTNCDTGMAGYPDRLFLTGGSGSPAEGYTLFGLHYTYNVSTKIAFSPEELTLCVRGYLEGKPHTPVMEISTSCGRTENEAPVSSGDQPEADIGSGANEAENDDPSLSENQPNAGFGYVGYSLAVRFDEELDSVTMRETGETLPVTDQLLLLPLSSPGLLSLTISAQRDGFTSPYAETVIVEVREAPEGLTLSLPPSVTEIGEEAFRASDMVIVRAPNAVAGPLAFANCSRLLLAELAAVSSPDVFSGSPSVIAVLPTPDFTLQSPFLIK